MVNPLTRKEIFEEAIAKGKVPTIKPLTRQEIIMAKEAEREASGGPGGSSVGGYIMELEIGTDIAEFAPGDEPMVVETKSYDEMYDVLNNGGNVWFRFKMGDLTSMRLNVLYWGISPGTGLTVSCLVFGETPIPASFMFTNGSHH